jgi:uncharacterized protein (TIRG00374 family)
LAKRFLVPLIKILVSAALVIFLLSRLGFDTIQRSISDARPGWVLFAVIVFSASNILGAVQWNILLRTRDIRFSFWKTLSYYYTGLFLNNFLVGYVGGDAFRAYDAAKESGKTSTAISTVFLDRVIGFTVLTSLALAASVFWSGLLTSSRVVFVVLFILAIWFFALLFFFNIGFARKFEWLFTLFLPRSFLPRLKSIYRDIHAYQENGTALLKVLVLSLFIQVMRILVHFLAAYAVGVRVSFAYFLIFVPVIALAASLPISIGGIGVREQSGVLLFSQIGVPEPATVALEFLAYLVGIIATLPGGLIFIIRKEHSKIDEVRTLGSADCAKKGEHL